MVGGVDAEDVQALCGGKHVIEASRSFRGVMCRDVPRLFGGDLEGLQHLVED